MRRSIPLLLLVLSACAEIPAPNGQLARSQEAIDNASSLDASNFAPLELNAAQTKLKQGSEQINLDNAAATRLLQQAEMDARLASEKTRSAKAQTRNNELQSQLPASPSTEGVAP